jgi:hypothetical protein
VQFITDLRRRRLLRTDDLVWLVPLFLAVVQWRFQDRVTGGIRYEELAEAVRNVFFLDHRSVYDGGSTNVGWYATLLIVYSVFGFSLNTALYAKLVLYVASLFCILSLFRRWMRPALAVVPVAVIALSPTYLYFNASRTGLGVDLAYIPIVLFFLATADSSRGATRRLTLFVAFSISMVACLSYPTFVFFLPMLLGVVVLRIVRTTDESGLGPKVTALLTVVAGVLIPLIGTFAYVKNKTTLVLDQATGSGLFRGGGGFDPNLTTFGQTTKNVLRDLFIAGHSYYFNLTKAEFSDYYPLVALLALGFATAYALLTVPSLRVPICALLLTAVVGITAVGFSRDGSGQPGLRRATFVVGCFYVILSLVWAAIGTGKIASPLVRSLVAGATCLLLVHHVLVLPSNLAGISATEETVDDRWFTVAGDAQSSLNSLVDRTKVDDLYLSCPRGWSERTPCRFNEVYPAIAGACLWNNVACHPIFGADPGGNGFVRLDVTLWTSRRLPS